MRFFKISDSADRERVERLVRTSQLASNAVKQERYRQRMKNYREKITCSKPGQKMPDHPKPPKPDLECDHKIGPRKNARCRKFIGQVVIFLSITARNNRILRASEFRLNVA